MTAFSAAPVRLRTTDATIAANKPPGKSSAEPNSQSAISRITAFITSVNSPKLESAPEG